jgi:hypothetical protein
MNLYSGVLYVHILATLVLFSALCMEALVLYNLRRASCFAEVRSSINAVPGLRWISAGSLLIVWLSGGYLAERASLWSLAWPKVSVAVVVLLGALSGISFRRIRKLRQPEGGEFAKSLSQTWLQASLGIRAGLIFGLILLMVTKPPLLGSIVILAVGSLVMYLATAFHP